MSAVKPQETFVAAGSGRSRPWIFHPALLLGLRLLLAAFFIYAATQKIGKPRLFADEIRAYGFIDYGPPLYIMAIVLPWMELLCGLALVVGVLLRGAAFALLVLNVVFIAVISHRSASIVRAGTPFLEVYFDCGCGFGATYAWKKLAEDAVFLLVSGVLLFAPVHRFAVSLRRRSK